MRLAAVAVGIGAVLAAALRLRGSMPAEPSPGGWRELGEDELTSPAPSDGGPPAPGSHGR